MNSVSSLYACFLVDPDLPVSAQWRVYDYAWRTKDHSLLAELVEYPNLDPDLDAALGRIDSAKVRARWIARPGRDAADAAELIAREKRIGVLTALAALDGLPQEAYHTILSRASSWKTFTTLVVNEAVPSDIRMAAAGRLTETFDSYRSWREIREVKAVLEAHPEFADAAAAKLSRAELAGALAGSELLSEASVRNLVEIAVLRPLRKILPAIDANRRSQGGNVHRAIRDSLDILGKLGENIAMGPQVRAEVQAFLEENLTALITPGSDFKTRIEGVIKLLSTSGQGTTVAQKLMSARTTSDPDTIAALVAEVVATRETRLATVLAANLAVTAPDVERIADLVDYSDRLSVIKRRQRDPEVLAVLLSRSVHLVSDEILSNSGAPEEVLLAIVRSQAARGFGSGYLLQSRFLTARIAGELPVTTVTATRELPAHVCVALRERVEARLGEGDGAWITFEGLLPGFTGTVDELLASVSAIIS